MVIADRMPFRLDALGCGECTVISGLPILGGQKDSRVLGGNFCNSWRQVLCSLLNLYFILAVCSGFTHLGLDPVGISGLKLLKF